MKEKSFRNDHRRSFIKGALMAGAAALVGSALSGKARAEKDSADQGHGQEILYRETEEFRAYYDSLSD